MESQHRGHIVEVDQAGTVHRLLGDPDHVVWLRSTAKPFALVALIEAGGVEAFDLATEDLALMASSHSGEDVHVRTLAALFRRAGLSQSALATGIEGMPLDALTAARLARDGERPGPLRHMCSGQHTALLLLSRLRGWPLETYWQDEHPAQAEVRRVIGRVLGQAPERLRSAVDGCGVPTVAASLSALARAYAVLADPAGVADADPRAPVATALVRIRDAMLAHPELIGGTRDRLDTSLMKAAPGRLVSKAGAEGLRGIAVLPGGGRPARALALKLEDGGDHQHAAWAVAVEAAAQAELVDAHGLRALARYHRPPRLDPHGRTVAESVAQFDLAPVRELIP